MMCAYKMLFTGFCSGGTHCHAKHELLFLCISPVTCKSPFLRDKPCILNILFQYSNYTTILLVIAVKVHA